MRVEVRLFASHREALGQDRVTLELEEGATVGHLVAALLQAHPDLQDACGSFLVAVNREYAKPDTILGPGDEVALIPPIAGGGPFRITEEEVRPQMATEAVRRESHGAVVSFIGVVRQQSQGKQVLHLEYEAYPDMAEAKLAEIGAEIRERFGLEDVAIVHRIGRLLVGEIAVVIAVGAPHRQEAFAACHYAIDRIKQVVPIWKKEVFADGEVWVEEPSGLER